MIPQKETQRKQILDYMKEHDSITPMEALNLFGCFRLGARIWELRKSGYIIETVRRKKNGKQFAEYYLKGYRGKH